MKFECIFAMFTPRTKTYSICENGLFSYPFGSADSANIGYRLSLDAHSLNACRFLAEREAVAFLLSNTLKFHSGMPRTNEICVGAKHSTTSTRRSSAKTASRVSNPDADQSIADVLIELTEAYKVEKDAKNKAYYFILSNGLLDSFADFCRDYHSCDPHKDCVEYLLSKC